MRAIQLILVLAIFLQISTADAASVAIPLKTQTAPAGDLVYQGRTIDRDEAVTLQRRGVDLSKLDPTPNDVWNPKSLPLTDANPAGFPSDGATVDFKTFLLSSKGLYRVRVEASSRTYQMVLSLDTHAALMRAALLRKLGYPVQSPKHYRSLTLRFADQAKRTKFVDDLVLSTGKSEKRWVVSAPEHSTDLVLQDIVLEPAKILVPQYHWGAIPAAHLKGRRALRALIVPFALLELTESVNIFSWEVGRLLDNSAVLTHPYATSFLETTYEDARWIARPLAALSREDLSAIVREGAYPEDVATLVLEKLISRRNHLVQIFNIDTKPMPFDLNISSGAVHGGKLTKETYDGYALRFAYGDPESPLRAEEIGRFLVIEGASYGLSQLSQKMNEYFTEYSISDLAVAHQEDIKEDFIKHIMERPGVPYERKVGTWGGPVGGVSASGSRHVVTGTYYGSDSKVQMVDSFTAQGKVGYFMGVDGLPDVNLGATGNLVLQRNYTHVRPVADIKTALKANWKSVFVPTTFHKLAKAIENGPQKDAAEITTDLSLVSAEATSPSPDDRLQGFLEELQDGELLTVTDSLVAGAGVSASIPLGALMGLDPGSASVGIDLNNQYMIMSRTTYRRTSDGIQIYLQRIKSNALQAAVDFNFWMNILRMSYATRNATASTQAFLIDEIPAQDEKKTKLLASLKSLLSGNDSELLRENFRPYALDHELDSEAAKVKFLWWRWHQIEENHRMTVLPPSDPDHPFDPKTKERVFFSNRRISLKGKDPFSFLSDVVEGFAKGYGFATGASGSNPANTFLGSGHWSSMSAEAEITPGADSDPVAILESHWAGWSLPKKNLFGILDGLETKMKPMNLDVPLIRREVFSTTESLKLYDITSTLIVYPEGINQIEKDLLAPGESVKTVFAKLNALMPPKVYQDFKRHCDELKQRTIDEGAMALGEWLQLTYTEMENGKLVDLQCVDKWQGEILKLRKNKPELADAKIKWANSILSALFINDKAPMHTILKLVGNENFFFQIKVSGFRTGDENGDAEYLSDSMGSFDPKKGAGAFRDFATKYNIMSHEVQARYLGEGY